MKASDKRPFLVLLPGALGAATQFASLSATLEGEFQVLTPNFAGHGDAPLPAGADPATAFTLPAFAANLGTFLEASMLGPARLFGYSMGGYAALLLARARPDLVHSVVTLGTKFFWDEPTAAKEAGRLSPAVLQAKVPQFAADLAARHPALGWEAVVNYTAALLRALGAEPLLSPDSLTQVTCPVRTVVGDRDVTVTIEETAQAYRSLPQGQLQVLPGVPHPLERVAVATLAGVIREFFSAG